MAKRFCGWSDIIIRTEFAVRIYKFSGQKKNAARKNFRAALENINFSIYSGRIPHLKEGISASSPARRGSFSSF